MEFTQPYISIASHAAVSPKLFPPLVPALKSLLENPHEVVKKGEEGAQLYIELGNRGITEAVPFMVLSGQETLKKIQLSLISAHGRRHMLARGCLDSVEEAALKAKRHTSACFDLVTKETDNFSAATNIRLQLAKSKKRKLSSPPISHPSPQPFSSPPSALSGDLRPQFIAVPAPSPADVRVTLLGTGSATPSKHRSGSAILLQQTSSEGSLSSILLDVAESCVSQLFLACGGCETRFFRTLASM